MHELLMYMPYILISKRDKKMAVFIYLILFMIGTLIGSFCTLAVYRIPLKKDITHEHSFCPNCNHKLAFWDLIPVLSYIFLKGKCRYCGEKIRIRYFLLEVFSGLVVMLFGISLNFSFEKLEIGKYIYFVFGILYIVTLTLIAGIDKERKQIQKGVLLFGILIVGIYILYLSIVEQFIIDRYAIYLFFMFICMGIDAWRCKKNKTSNSTILILVLALLTLLFTGIKAFILTIILTLVAIGIETVRTKNKKEENLPIGFYLCVSNLVIFILQNFVYSYIK